MREINQFGPEESEERLVRALQRLSRESSRAASQEVAAGLAMAFHRHHRRRRSRNAAVAFLIICVLASAAVLVSRAQKTAPMMGKNPSSPSAVPVVPPAPPALVASTAEAKTKKTVQHDARQRSGRRQRTTTEARQSLAFLPLPSYDPAIAKDELQIIRVEMPIQDLRLVGAPVGADVPNRQVRADFVVGHDGTPYAVRLVQ